MDGQFATGTYHLVDGNKILLTFCIHLMNAKRSATTSKQICISDFGSLRLKK
jgi:hypothetical protein